MNTTRAAGLELARAVADAARAHPEAEVVVYPSFPFLEGVRERVSGSGLSVGGQDCAGHQTGAHTGQVSAAMLQEVGCASVLIGHSERRHGLSESDALLSMKLHRAVECGLQPVLCVGETLAQREEGNADGVIAQQLHGALHGHSEQSLAALVIAYEPVWAIGTGRTAAVSDAEAAHRTVRQTLADLYSARFAEQVRVVYGGSVHAKNAAELFGCEEIDGGLVGGASLVAADFATIIASAASRSSMRRGR